MDDPACSRALGNGSLRLSFELAYHSYVRTSNRLPTGSKAREATGDNDARAKKSTGNGTKGQGYFLDICDSWLR